MGEERARARYRDGSMFKESPRGALQSVVDVCMQKKLNRVCASVCAPASVHQIGIYLSVDLYFLSMYTMYL